MAREPKDVTDAELALLQVLWDRGRCSTRQITDVLYPAGAAAQYSTVQKLLERLEAKQFVVRDRSLFVHTFTADVGRDELIGRRLQGLADTLCGGSLAPIVSQLARSGALSESERKALRDLIDEADSGATDTLANRKRKTKG